MATCLDQWASGGTGGGLGGKPRQKTWSAVVGHGGSPNSLCCDTHQVLFTHSLLPLADLRQRERSVDSGLVSLGLYSTCEARVTGTSPAVEVQ